ncbi:hypothetical protein BT63DRAFT_439120 [Microthyrium microscopicum]|uniref:Small ribosomal subunit protein mS38 n=1 Tax=Microthyrium microscopicum TaxID=703497 RepID=A0A6A6UFV1_9PEZI|nr:hypothetical protein BT63DRAFT_439120 [Microthyrium microscopicum]
MITNSIVRCARTTCYPASTHGASFIVPGQAYQLATRTYRIHQRRYSSSKTSIPPNGSPRTRSTAPSQQTTSSTTGRVRGRKAKAPIVESGFSHLPSVPSTQHLHPADINVSSFFSLHRPISVTSAIPTSATPASFASIFDSPISVRHRPSDVMNTLGSAIDEFDAPGSQEDVFSEEALRRELQQDGTPTRAGVPKDVPASAKFSEFRPFHPPPVPEAVTETATPKRAGRPKSSKPRSWTTTITVTEHTTPTGQKVYSAASTPLEQLRARNERRNRRPAIVIEEPEGIPPAPVQQPFLQRMRIRQVKWQALSVKRQRKLKMKKHKYKKLMKRTRNLRRRLGKI